MSSSTHLRVSLLFAMGVFLALAQNQFEVGGADGWRVPDVNNPEFYINWAEKLRFQVGDSIIFKYKNDSVIRVEKRGYYHCNESSHDSIFKDGSTIFLFDRPGLFYFVSGNLEHCKQGQRLVVYVMESRRPLLPDAPAPSPSSTSAADGKLAHASFLGVVLMASLCALFILKQGLH